MSKFIVQLVDTYTRNVIETEDEIFESEEAAEEYACECNSNFAAGAEVLELAGEDFTDPDDEEYIVAEIDD